MSPGAHDPTNPDVIARLKSLHPTGSPAQLGALPPAVDPVLSSNHDEGFWDTILRDCVLRFPRASAPGPSGLRPSHLQDALRRRGGGLGLVRALASLTEKWVNGGLPPLHSPHLCGANLTPLKKGDGGVRPVAV